MRSDHLSKHVKTHNDVKKGESDSENSQDVSHNKASEGVKSANSSESGDMKIER